MKKLLCIALFSITFMANATETKEIVEKNSKEVTVEKLTSEKVANNFKEVKVEKEIFEDYMFFGCGSQGNSVYDELVGAGMSHRDARNERRAFVRDCGGNGPNGWLSICLFNC